MATQQAPTDIKEDIKSNEPRPNKTKPNEPESNEKLTGREKLSKCGAFMWMLLTSHLGLFILLILYTFFGAGLMLGIEGFFTSLAKEERAEKGYIPEANFLEYFLNKTLQNGIAENDLPKDTRPIGLTNDTRHRGLNVTFPLGSDELLKVLEQYEKEKTENNEKNTIREHSYWEWMLFCLTVYTTIGYGSIYPVTRPGRIATMFYATVGVPLFLLTMGKVGQDFTRAVKFLWSYARKCWYWNRIRPFRKSKVVQRLTCSQGDEVGNAKIHRMEGGKSGAGGNDHTGLTNDASKATKDSKTTATNEVNKSSSPNQLTVESQDHLDAVSYVSYQIDDEFNLHPLVAIIVTLVYILLGSLMYVQWEDDWAYHDAFYFVFISVSTIGFGDLVPTHPKFFLLSSIYILFGLALVAMVINVLMEFFNENLETVIETIPELIGDSDDEDDEERKDIKAGLEHLAGNFQHVRETQQEA